MSAALLPRAVLSTAVARAGWPAVLGVALLLVAAALYAIGIAPDRQRLASALERASVLRRAPVRVAAPPPGTAEQLAHFRQLFPAEKDVARIAGKVIAAAHRHRLVARQVGYRFEQDKSLGLTRMHMAMPLKGEYVAIRRFLADVHREVPALALEQVQFERRTAGDRGIEARVVLRIHLGQQ